MALTVLIADDETMPRRILREHLPWDELGVTCVTEASDGDEAVEQARVCRPDIFITDVKMPHRNGLEAALIQLYREFARHPGTDMEYLRHIYCQIIFLFLNAAETCNVTAAMEPADLLLYSAVKQETPEQLWGVLLRTARDYFRAVEPRDADIVSKVEQYLARRYADCSLTVQDMAGDLGYTNAYLCASYKKSCGKTINQRLTELRLEQAKERLARSDQKLYEIAHAVGYSDGKYFTKLFTREVGLSPKEYREKRRGE